MHRFVKLNAAGEVLPEGVTEGHVITRDNQTKLDWDVAEFDGKEFTLKGAEKACKDLRTGDHADWRLPTIQELLSLVDYAKYDPAIDKDFFPNARSDWYRTSTPCAGSSDYAWSVYFASGGSFWVNHSSRDYVRACRPSQAV